MKKLLFLVVLAASINVAAQSTGYYLYHGNRTEVTINDSVLLVYFDASLTDTATIQSHYDCMRGVVLDSNMSDSLIAYEISIEAEEYAATINRLKLLPEVRDVEPVIGIQTRVPVSNVFYVRLNSYEDTALLMDMAVQHGVAYRGLVSTRGTWYALEVSKESSANALALSNVFGESGLFADVDPGFIFELQFNTADCPDDPDIVNQWAIDMLGLCDVWDAGYKGYGTKIAIIDDGIDFTHSELSTTSVVGSFNAYSPYGGPAAGGKVHGTQVAGVILAAHNSSMIAGLAPEAYVYNINIVYNSISPSYFTQNCEYSIKRAFDYAIDSNIDVLLCAWELKNDGTNTASTMIESAIEDALENGRCGKGSVVVFASGIIYLNNNDVVYPANFDDRLVVVGASCENRSRYNQSSYGDKLDVVAPGDNISTTGYLSYTQNFIIDRSGSSLGAAHVAGVAALMLQKNPNLTNAQVEWILKRTATKFPSYTFSSTSAHPVSTWNNELGYGEIHALRAMRSVDTANYPVTFYIKDFASDDGLMPSNLAYGVTTSPSIKVYDSPNHQTTTLYRGNTYTVKVRVTNNTNQDVYLMSSDVHVLVAPTANNMTWNGSFPNNSTTIHATGAVSPTPCTVPANSSYEFPITLIIPLNYLKPSVANLSVTLVAYVASIVIPDINNTNEPLEGFVRWDRHVAMRNGFTVSDDNILPPINSTGITSVSPNPTSGDVNVEYQLAEDCADVQILLLNANGVTVLRTAANGNRCRLNTSGLPAGEYFVNLLVGNVVKDVKALIVQ